jgi:hypothetical protein
MSELFDEVLERTIDEADNEVRQCIEAEADMANVLQWISRMHRAGNDDAVTLAPEWMNA